MSLTMYDASVTVFLHNLKQLSHLLDKAQAHAAEKGTAPSELEQARLADDMRPLPFQIQAACDAAKLAVARVTGTEAPVFEDNESSFDELKDRIARTRSYLQSVPREAFEGSETRAFTMQPGRTVQHHTGQPYLLHFALPNFFFHVTTAYAILRHKGVALDKRDFLGKPE